LQAAEDKRLNDDLRKDYGLPATASDKELQAAKNAAQEADIARLKSLVSEAAKLIVAIVDRAPSAMSMYVTKEEAMQILHGFSDYCYSN